jgi:hypothetical protein
VANGNASRIQLLASRRAPGSASRSIRLTVPVPASLASAGAARPARPNAPVDEIAQPVPVH